MVQGPGGQNGCCVTDIVAANRWVLVFGMHSGASVVPMAVHRPEIATDRGEGQTETLLRCYGQVMLDEYAALRHGSAAKAGK